jgi:hypothetical protein
MRLPNKSSSRSSTPFGEKEKEDVWLLREVFGWRGGVLHADQGVGMVGKKQVVAVGRVDE